MLFKQTGYVVFLVLLLSTLSFVNAHDENEHDDDSFSDFNDEEEGYTTEDHIEVREQTSFVKPKTLNSGKDLPPITILYCTSCGYKRTSEGLSSFLQEKYPNLVVRGGNYAPDAWKAYLANAIGVLKMGVFVMIVTGYNPFERFGYGYPAFLQYAHNNKLSVCMMVFMLSNLVEGSLISTGAFEVYLGEELIWSKLQSGRMPSPEEMVQLMEAQMAILGVKAVGSETAFGDFAAAN